MLRIFRVFKNLYAKLIATAAIGVLLVAGMILNEQFSNRSISHANASSSNQNAVLKEVLLAHASYLRGQNERRDIALAHNLSTAQKAFEDMKRSGAEALAHAKAAAEHAVDPENRTRLQQFSGKLEEFISLSLAMAKTHFDMVKQQGGESDLMVKWNQEMQAALALPEIQGNAGVEPRIHDAATAMLDANVAYWRYATLQEPVVLGKMYQAADKVYIELQRARTSLKDAKTLAAIDAMLDLTQKMNDVVDATKASYDGYRKLDNDRNTPLRAELEDVIAKISATSDDIARRAETSVVADMTRSARVGLGVGLFVIAVLIASAVFSMLTFRRHAAASRAADTRAAAMKLEAEEQASAERKAAREKADVERKTVMSRLADEFEQAVGKIVDTVSTTSMELEAAAGSMSTTAETTQQLSAAVASASEESSTNVQSVASAADEMATSVSEISRQVQESSRIATEAVAQARETDARISELSQAAGRIGDVVKLITAIAEQTNLLALNATIEAARAGASGKGFAVVAQEVKQLAAQTAKATDEIRGQIAGMQTATHESVAAIKEIGETIARISEIATTVATAVEEQGASTQEIARNVQQAAQGTAQVTGNIGEVTRGASETGSAASQVLISAQSLANESNHLKSEVAKFLDNVRAA
jgi:methyl-accepting chemotaxis protein